MSNTVAKAKSLLTLNDSNWLKGLAIIAVIWIHVTSALPSSMVWSPTYRMLFVFLDQLSRFCVPVFIFVSGFGLAVSETQHHLTYLEFFKKRVIRLLPLYLWWSFVFLVLFKLFPYWGGSSAPIHIQFILGQADYQLYFVPLIFVLYVLFPLLYKIVKKLGIVAVIMAVVIQLLTFFWFSHGNFEFLKLPYLQIDQFQYLFPLSWIAYFALGIWATSWKKLTMPTYIWRGGWLIAWLLVAGRADYLVAHGLDPLLALKFTRPEVLGYAVMAIMGLLTFVPSRQKITGLISKGISFLGHYSYLLFLAHTWAIRIIIGYMYQRQPVPILLMVSVFWLTSLAISLLIMRLEQPRPSA